MKPSKIKDIFQALEVVLSAEDKEKLAQISQAYFETVDENFTLREENYKLNRQLIDKEIQIKELNDQLEERQKLQMKVNDGIPEYFLEREGGEEIGPVCPKCYKQDGATIILQTSSNNCAFCPNCKSSFTGVHAIIEGHYGEMW